MCYNNDFLLFTIIRMENNKEHNNIIKKEIIDVHNKTELKLEDKKDTQLENKKDNKKSCNLFEGCIYHNLNYII